METFRHQKYITKALSGSGSGMKTFKFPVNVSIITSIMLSAAYLFSNSVVANTFNFSWDIPSQARVKCSVQDRGVTTHGEWTLIAESSGSADQYVIRLIDYVVLDIEGVSPDQVQQIKNNPIMKAAQGLIPSFIVDSAGSVLETGSLLPLVDELVGAINDPSVAQQVGNYLRSPTIQQALTARVANYWEIWVGAYVGLDINAGEKIEFSTPVVLGEIEFPAKITIEHLGTERNTRYVRLRVTSIYEGPEFESYMKEIILNMTGQFPLPADQQDLTIELARKKTTINAVTEPNTLYPSKIFMTEEDTIKVQGETQQTRTKTNNCFFSWNN